MNSLRERFDEFHSPNTFSLATKEHKLTLYIGLDAEGNKALKFRGKFTYEKISGTALISVKQFKSPQYNTLLFSLLDNSFEEVFFRFCEDLIEMTMPLDDSAACYRLLRDRFLQWKKMFINAKRDLLTEFQILGLIGEILFLREFLIPKYGEKVALQGWSGQELTHKDFSYAKEWYEIKTILDSSVSVKISSLEQLDSDLPGVLSVYKMEKMSPEFSGISLNSLVQKMAASFSDSELRDRFLDKVSSQGFSFREEYDDFVYRKKENMLFSVDIKFPRLTRRDIPEAILKATYEIALTEMAPFQILLPEK